MGCLLLCRCYEADEGPPQSPLGLPSLSFVQTLQSKEITNGMSLINGRLEEWRCNCLTGKLLLRRRGT